MIRSCILGLNGALLLTSLFYCDPTPVNRPPGAGAQPAEAESGAAHAAEQSGALMCAEILRALKDGKVAQAMQRNFNHQASAVRFTDKGRIEWFIDDQGPGELPVGTVYQSAQMDFHPLRIQTKQDHPLRPVVLVSCKLSELAFQRRSVRQLDIEFTVRADSPDRGTESFGFAGAQETEQIPHCFQYFTRTGEIRRCRPVEPGELQ